MSLLFFTYGLVVGSFSLALAHRYGLSGSTLTRRSCCEACGNQLNWYELLPVFSYVLLRGHCKHCKVAISYIYPLVELISGAIFVGIYFKYGLSQEILLYLSLAVFTPALFIVDLKFYVLPNKWVFIHFLITLAMYVYIYTTNFEKRENLKHSLIAALLVGVVLLLINLFTNGAGMGMGDVKLAPLLIVTAGLARWEDGVASLIYSLSLAGFLAIMLLLLGKVTSKTRVPLGPFLLIGTWIAILIPDYFNSQIMTLFLIQ